MGQTQRPGMSCGSMAVLAGLAVGAASPVASATWSVLIADTRTGEIAVGSATCLTGINLRSETPVLLLGRGAATAQSAVDSSGRNRARIFSGFARGLGPGEIFAELAATMILGLPLGFYLGMGVIIAGLVITRVYLAKVEN